jgi:hypothetical protein
MKRQVLFILIGALLCFVAGPTLTNAADTYCPSVHVPPGGICDCTVFNYGPTADTGVVIEMYDDRGGYRDIPPSIIPPGTSLYISWPFDYPGAWTAVGCKVHGTSVHSRVSIQCYPHQNNDLGNPYVSYAFAVCGD